VFYEAARELNTKTGSRPSSEELPRTLCLNCPVEDVTKDAWPHES